MVTFMQILILIFVYMVVLIISVAMLRWAFRINAIVERLEHISTSNHRIEKTLENIRSVLTNKDDLPSQPENE